MDKIYDWLNSFWISYVSDVIPDYIDKALNYLSFIMVLLILTMPIWGFWLVIKIISMITGGGRYED